ncbi:hypothetical protein M422DRAFT_269065 [Sphaerobolus stellatus SS14]|uniref:Uncharacterized protein n=1 Tax=Sphaerobolus stellatus (strain SS14) TaxID=990650 RepID=A0A0C9UWK5_SPHS4|nr:hypothetical protein M422DRAFT_269065 [Sphaerobolus stellatus SS14]
MANKVYRVRWAHVTAAEARGDTVEVTAKQSATQIPWKVLDWNSKRSEILNAKYMAFEQGSPENEIEDYTFLSTDNIQQNEAGGILAMHGLDEASVEDISSRWSIRWSRISGKGDKAERRVLYQW